MPFFTDNKHIFSWFMVRLTGTLHIIDAFLLHCVCGILLFYSGRQSMITSEYKQCYIDT